MTGPASRRNISVAIDDYDHVRALASGEVAISGASLSFHRMSRPAETFHRQFRFGEWDVSEFSLALFCSLVGADDDRFVGLPVFPSRKFRHSSIYVRSDAPFATLEDLAGSRIGVPEWAQTAGVWVRGMLADHYGVDLSSISWFQGGVESLGRSEHAEVWLPEGVEVQTVQDAPLAQKLVQGELDAVIAARFPYDLIAAGKCRTLLPDPRSAEAVYWSETGIFPIMHLLVVRRDVYEQDRWLAKELVRAFTAAKDISVRRLASVGTPMFPLPHLAEEAGSLIRRFGPDPWPYGLEANRAALSSFVRYVNEQGISRRKIAIDELFVASATDEFHG
jgi:4,5-dihydroxyphthalate decarboxylase